MWMDNGLGYFQGLILAICHLLSIVQIDTCLDISDKKEGKGSQRIEEI